MTRKHRYYAYHVTLRTFLPSIYKQGLLPQEHAHLDEPGVFFEPDEEGAAIYHEPPNTLLLRWPLSGEPVSSTEDGEYAEYETVPPEILEVKDAGKWIPISDMVWTVGLSVARHKKKEAEWDDEYGQPPTYARNFERQRVAVSQIASPFMNPVTDARIDELERLENEGYSLPPVILAGPGTVEDEDFLEERYPFLDGHYPIVGEDVWYVHDGHHRVSLAIRQGRKYIEALILEDMGMK